MQSVAVIGAGFSGLSAAAYLAAEGYEVHLYEKNNTIGGRARQLITDNGYTFDMGPSWYWMPGVFQKFFNDFGKNISSLYNLKLLDPSFEIIFGNDSLKIPAGFDELCHLFESVESGSSAKLIQFMKEAEYKYKIGINQLVYKPGLSIAEFADMDLLKGMFRVQVFSSFSKHVRKYFRHPKLIALMEFPVLFLGAMPQETPALYSLMNYAGLKLGTWYPMGGFGKVIDAMKAVGEENNVTIHCNAEVEAINVAGTKAKSIVVNGNTISFDGIIAAADYHHVEDKLLPEKYRNYSNEYWQQKTFAPSCLIYYIGINKRINALQHHTLFFDEELLQHSKDIYKNPAWPGKPLFYVCCPSKTDDTVAPAGHENLFLLMPIAAGLNDSEDIREKYFMLMVERLEKQTNENILPYIDFKKSYCVTDFITDYHSYKGNAYGLANTLLQTAILKPKINNKKIKNLFYAGQLTVPGPGVPPSIISGNIAAKQMSNYLKILLHETVI